MIGEIQLGGRVLKACNFQAHFLSSAVKCRAAAGTTTRRDATPRDESRAVHSSRVLRTSPGTPYRSRTLASDRALIEISLRYDLIRCSSSSNCPSARQDSRLRRARSRGCSDGNLSFLSDFSPSDRCTFARGMLPKLHSVEGHLLACVVLSRSFLWMSPV